MGSSPECNGVHWNEVVSYLFLIVLEVFELNLYIGLITKMKVSIFFAFLSYITLAKQKKDCNV